MSESKSESEREREPASPSTGLLEVGVHKRKLEYYNSKVDSQRPNKKKGGTYLPTPSSFILSAIIYTKSLSL